jgi:voltage-gated potassium channel
MIVVVFAFMATAPDTEWARSVIVFLQSGTLVIALWTSGLTKYAKLSLTVVGVGVALAVLLVLDPSRTLTGIVGIFELVLTLSIAAIVAFGIIDQGEINEQSVMGAICVYVLLGLVFTFFYGTIATLDSAPFFTQGTDGTVAIRLYYSYITLTTVGYGDYSPATNLGHLLAMIEALTGQLYLVTVVAVLVSRMKTRSQR